MDRASGILLHISSLPSPYGIGTLGEEAYRFVDFLKSAQQRYWQMLPMGPTSYGDSPYQSFSAFAGNPYFIDLRLLEQDGLLATGEYENLNYGDKADKVDYGALFNVRGDVLHLAFERGYERDKDGVLAFAEENAHWIHDYALFMALKAHFGMRSWLEWDDEDIRLRRAKAMKKYSALLHNDVNYHIYVQYLFFKQWKALKEYIKENGVKLIGDLPIYVALDSADVWACPKNYKLDEKRRPIAVAGVPPDYFSETGQLWGNPLYNWARMKRDGYSWWKARLKAVGDMFDVVRIDHFRGFESYWSVPFGSETAAPGEWVKGPGMHFINSLKEALPDVEIIAEDLGFLTDGVRKLLKDSGYPGMKVLQFAFDSREPSNYLPHTYEPHCACYTGTHDNTTAAAWFFEAAKDDIAFAHEYLGLNEEEGLHMGLVRGGMSSVANLFVAQMQDYLALGEDARMNTPSTLGDNWQWRLNDNEITEELTNKIARITWMNGRMVKQ